MSAEASQPTETPTGRPTETTATTPAETTGETARATASFTSAETTAVGRARLGVMFDRDRPVRELPGFCAELEAAGVDDVWLVEDLTWAGSIATSATALAVTERLRVGIGVAPAPFRNPALLAMELATLAELYPGRFIAGIGHGVQSWMAQVGAKVPAPLGGR